MTKGATWNGSSHDWRANILPSTPHHSPLYRTDYAPFFVLGWYRGGGETVIAYLGMDSSDGHIKCHGMRHHTFLYLADRIFSD